MATVDKVGPGCRWCRLAVNLLAYLLDGVHTPPTATDNAQFFDQFWPNLVATGLGIALGIPAALSGERLLERRRDTADKARRDQRRAILAMSLIESLEHNHEMLEQVRSTIATRGQGFFGLGFDIGRWEMVRTEASVLFEDVELVGSLASLYEELTKVEELVDLHRDYEVGSLSSSPHAPTVLTQLVEHLTEHCESLLAAIDDLLGKLRTYLNP